MTEPVSGGGAISDEELADHLDALDYYDEHADLHIDAEELRRIFVRLRASEARAEAAEERNRVLALSALQQSKRAQAAASRLAAADALHFARPETMCDEDAEIASPADDDVLVDVMVCDHCFHLVYPEGNIEEYCDPDVFWPCPTAKALGHDAQPQPTPSRKDEK